MPVPGGGFEQCCNGQAVVAEGSLLVVAGDVVQATNGKQQLEPTLAKTAALPDGLGKAKPCWPITAISARPMQMPAKRPESSRYLPWAGTRIIALRRGFGCARKSNTDRDHGPPPANARGQEALWLTQTHPKPVFCIIKSVLGFRQFLLRGLDQVKGEWSLVTMAWNLKRMFVLKAA